MGRTPIRSMHGNWRCATQAGDANHFEKSEDTRPVTGRAMTNISTSKPAAIVDGGL